MKFLILALILTVGSLASVSSFAEGDSSDLRVLFVGNSITGFNNTPGLFRELASELGHKPYVEVSIKFGKTLGDQLADPVFVTTLKSKPWDFVVLQEYSSLPVTDTQSFLAHVQAVKNILGAKPTKIVLFENWIQAGQRTRTIQSVAQVFAKVSKLTHTSVVRVGEAFTHAADRTEIGMYQDDWHPTPIASYLATLMFLKYFYAVNPSLVAHTGANKNTADVTNGEASAASLIPLDTVYTPTDVSIIQATAAAYSAKSSSK